MLAAEAGAENRATTTILADIFCEKGRIAQDFQQDKVAEEAFQKANALSESSLNVSADSKAMILEKYAEVCRQSGQAPKAKMLLARAEKILPSLCRQPWKNFPVVAYVDLRID